MKLYREVHCEIIYDAALLLLFRFYPFLMSFLDPLQSLEQCGYCLISTEIMTIPAYYSFVAKGLMTLPAHYSFIAVGVMTLPAYHSFVAKGVMTSPAHYSYCNGSNDFTSTLLILQQK